MFGCVETKAPRLPLQRAVPVRQKVLADFSRVASGGAVVPGYEPAAPHPVAGERVSTWAIESERFLEWKQSEAPVGEAWIDRMRWELLRFPLLLERAGALSIARDPRDVVPEMVASLRRGLPWEKATFALHFTALRQFLAWAGNPIAARRSVWALPSGEPTHRRWLTKDQLLRLYRASTGFGRVIVALEGLNGFRRVEVLRLRAKDVTLDEGCIAVLGKGRNGGKWRKVPIYPSVRPVLEQALVGLRPSDRVVPLSKSGADLLLAKAATAAGLAEAKVRVSHHDLRRTFGCLAHAAGTDLIQLKNLFGHSSLEMTVHYIGLDADTMREGLERLSVSLGHLE